MSVWVGYTAPPPQLRHVEISCAPLWGSKSNEVRDRSKVKCVQSGEDLAGLVRKARSQQLRTARAQLCAEIVRIHAGE